MLFFVLLLLCGPRALMFFYLFRKSVFELCCSFDYERLSTFVEKMELVFTRFKGLHLVPSRKVHVADSDPEHNVRFAGTGAPRLPTVRALLAQRAG